MTRLTSALETERDVLRHLVGSALGGITFGRW
jgi:hypothetical protein